MIQRRAFLTGLSALIAAPAVVRADTLMRVRSIIVPPPRIALQIFNKGAWANEAILVPPNGSPYFDALGDMSRAIMRVQYFRPKMRFVGSPSAITAVRDQFREFGIAQFATPEKGTFVRGIPLISE